MKWVDALTDVMNRIAAVFLFAMMMLTAADVFMRKVFSTGVLGALELTEFMMVGLVFFALARVEALGRNISVDLVLKRLPRRIRLLATLVTRLVCFSLFCLVTASAVVYAQTLKASHEATVDLWIPRYPLVYVAAAGCAALSLILMMRCLSDILELKKSWTP